MPFVEQLAAVGSEVTRAISWRERENPAYSQLALNRALELLSFAVADANSSSARRELTRVKELLATSFEGDVEFELSKNYWRGYFAPFTYAAQLRRGR